jgi:hypothetical protein
MTFAQAKARFGSLATADTSIGEAIQEAVDRAYEMGRWRGMVEELLIPESYFVELDDELFIDFPADTFDGALGFRNKSMGWGIRNVAALYRDGINSGDRSFIDKGEVLVGGVLVRRYRLPVVQNRPTHVLIKLTSAPLTDDDLVPIKSVGALKNAILAVCAENSSDDSRANTYWGRFLATMERAEKQHSGLHQFHVSFNSNLRRRPSGFM